MFNREACRCFVEAEPGKLDIKRREPSILFISYSLVHSLNSLDLMEKDNKN